MSSGRFRCHRGGGRGRGGKQPQTNTVKEVKKKTVDVGDVDSNSKDYISICILEEWLLHD